LIIITRKTGGNTIRQPIHGHKKSDFGGTARRNAIAVSIGSKIYVGFGNDGSGCKDLWRYDPSDDSWTKMGDFLNLARWSAIAAVAFDKIFFGTGYDGIRYNDFHWIF